MAPNAEPAHPGKCADTGSTYRRGALRRAADRLAGLPKQVQKRAVNRRPGGSERSADIVTDLKTLCFFRLLCSWPRSPAKPAS
jgi:hypothetical protein